MAACSDVARRLGISDRTVRRACDERRIAAVRNERGEWDVDDRIAGELRAEDVLRRQTTTSPRASMLLAYESIERLCRALGAGDESAVRAEATITADRLDEARREARRALREVGYAAGISGRSPSRDGP